ncbi:MAG: hypothetical protein AABW79_01970 [Nanoarchaeota archaeon]
MKRGDTDTRFPLVQVVLVVLVIASTALFFSNNDFRNKFDSILPGFGEPSDLESKEIIVRYSLADGSVGYYTGVEWKAIDSEGGLRANGNVLNGEQLVKDFEDYYFSTANSGKYSDEFKELGIREVPFVIAPPDGQKNEQNNFLLGRAVIEEFYRISPDKSMDEEGLVFGNIFRVGEIGDFERNLFYLNDENNFFVSGSFLESQDEFIKTGYILNDVAVIYPEAVSRLLDVQTYLRALEIHGLYLDKRDNYFYEAGRKTAFSIRDFEGKLFVYYGDTKLDMQVGFSDGDNERVIRSYSENFMDFKQSSTKNELLIIQKIIEWRDAIFKVPIEIHYAEGSEETSESACVERPKDGKPYLIVRLNSENFEGVCDVA